MFVAAAVITHPEAGVVAIGISTTQSGALSEAIYKIDPDIDCSERDGETDVARLEALIAQAEYKVEYEFASL